MTQSCDRFIEPNSGPLMELERWHRQQRLLTSIAEQLKSKDCKAVISVLITCKSRLLKKWKIVDARFAHDVKSCSPLIFCYMILCLELMLFLSSVVNVACDLTAYRIT